MFSYVSIEIVSIIFCIMPSLITLPEHTTVKIVNLRNISHLYEKYDTNSVQAALLLAIDYIVEQRGFIASCVNSTGL